VAHEFDRNPHSRIISEKLTAVGDVISSAIFVTQVLKSAGIRDGGIGRLLHDVRRAHICSI
jgi:hypothetical protein